MATIPKGQRVVTAHSLTDFKKRLQELGVEIFRHDGIVTVTPLGNFSLSAEEIMLNNDKITNDDLDALVGNIPVKPAKSFKKQHIIQEPDDEHEIESSAAPQSKEAVVRATSEGDWSMWD